MGGMSGRRAGPDHSQARPWLPLTLFRSTSGGGGSEATPSPSDRERAGVRVGTSSRMVSAGAVARSVVGDSRPPVPRCAVEGPAHPQVALDQLTSQRVVSVAHLVSHPVQYYVPLYRELASRPAIALTVYYYSSATLREFHDPGFGRAVRWDTELLDGYRARFCASAERARVGGGWRRQPNWDVVREVVRGGFDVVWLHGYNHPTSVLAAMAARAVGARLLIREDQTLLDPRPWWKRAAKAVILRALFSQATGLYVGARNRQYFAHYGIPDCRLFAAPHCVDNTLFRARAAALASERQVIRARLGISDGAPVVLFCGKLIDKKQPRLLLEAYDRIRRERACWLLLAGDGAERAAIETFVRSRGLPRVVLAGFLNQSELPAAYTAADLLVLPSAWHETWGLVVNEAMNFGLPVVVSDKVGCAADLVRHGWNGFVVPHRDAEALAEAIGRLVVDPLLRAEFGARSRALVEAYSIERCADGIVAACREARRGDGRAA
jgi:glycosyltransferase involved in cell wall biosynthesis